MFNAHEKMLIVSALEMAIAAAVRAQKAARFPEMGPIFEKAISNHRAIIEKVQNAKG